MQKVGTGQLHSFFHVLVCTKFPLLCIFVVCMCISVFVCMWKYVLRLKVGQIATALDLCVGAAAKSVPYTNRHLSIHMYMNII